MQRVGTMAGNPQLKLTEKERTLMTINVQVFVHSMIGLVEVLLNYGDILYHMMCVRALWHSYTSLR